VRGINDGWLSPTLPLSQPPTLANCDNNKARPAPWPFFSGLDGVVLASGAYSVAYTAAAFRNP
jgi:hypothetical protein